MKIIIDFPPNIKEIRKHFELPGNVVFTYGETLYNPGNGEITKDLEVHEETHAKQQGSDPEAWWTKYLADPNFRLQQEIEAYKNQWREFSKTNKDRNKTFMFIHHIAGDLSSPMYGSVISYEQAKKLIKS